MGTGYTVLSHLATKPKRILYGNESFSNSIAISVISSFCPPCAIKTQLPSNWASTDEGFQSSRQQGFSPLTNLPPSEGVKNPKYFSFFKHGEVTSLGGELVESETPLWRGDRHIWRGIAKTISISWVKVTFESYTRMCSAIGVVLEPFLSEKM